jgi:hypothetical protein
MKNLGFHNILYPLWEKGGINAFSIFARNRIETLDDPRIIPLASPVNQPGPKPDSTRVQPTGGDETAGWELYAETVVLIEKRPAPRREIMHKLGSMRLLYQVSRLAETH